MENSECLFNELRVELVNLESRQGIWNILDSIGDDKVPYICNAVEADKFSDLRNNIVELQKIIRKLFSLYGFNSETYISTIGGAHPFSDQLSYSVISWLIDRKRKLCLDSIIQEFKDWLTSNTHEVILVFPFFSDYILPEESYKLEEYLIQLSNLNFFKGSRIERLCLSVAHGGSSGARVGRLHCASDEISIMSAVIQIPKLQSNDFDWEKVYKIQRIIQRKLPFYIRLFGISQNIKCFILPNFLCYAPPVPIATGLCWNVEPDSFDALRGHTPEFSKMHISENEIDFNSFQRLCTQYDQFQDKERINMVLDRLNSSQLNWYSILEEKEGHFYRNFRSLNDAWIDLRIVLEVLLCNPNEKYKKTMKISNRSKVLLMENDKFKEDAKKIYDYCSMSVHSGQSSHDLEYFDKGINISKQLIKLYLQKGKFPNFNILEITRNIDEAFV